MLAQKLKWPFALSLLAAPLFASAGRRAAENAVDGDATARVLFGYAKGAAHACDLSAELRRRAQKLAEAAAKLRAKGAKAALQALLDQDSLAAATPIAGLSERGTRRLFERLGGARRDPRTDRTRDVPALRALAMARAGKNCGELDRELEDLPPAARWREWMGRVEAAVFASARPVLRENLAGVVGQACNLDLIIDDIEDELRGRPYEIVAVAGGWLSTTRFGAAIRAALGGPTKSELSKRERGRV